MYLNLSFPLVVTFWDQEIFISKDREIELDVWSWKSTDVLSYGVDVCRVQ